MESPVCEDSLPYLSSKAEMSFRYFSVLSFLTVTLGAASFSKRLEVVERLSAPNILAINSVNMAIHVSLISSIRIWAGENGKIAILGKNNALSYILGALFLL